MASIDAKIEQLAAKVRLWSLPAEIAAVVAEHNQTPVSRQTIQIRRTARLVLEALDTVSAHRKQGHR